MRPYTTIPAKDLDVARERSLRRPADDESWQDVAAAYQRIARYWQNAFLRLVEEDG